MTESQRKASFQKSQPRFAKNLRHANGFDCHLRHLRTGLPTIRSVSSLGALRFRNGKRFATNRSTGSYTKKFLDRGAVVDDLDGRPCGVILTLKRIAIERRLSV